MKALKCKPSALRNYIHIVMVGIYVDACISQSVSARVQWADFLEFQRLLVRWQRELYTRDAVSIVVKSQLYR